MRGLIFIRIVPSSEGMKENNDEGLDYFSWFLKENSQPHRIIAQRYDRILCRYVD